MNNSTQRTYCVEVPEKPSYPREVDENVDSVLEEALDTVEMADNEHLTTLLANELASHRIDAGVSND